MAREVINGVLVRYHIIWNVSHNRANPHRLSATCACGIEFLQMACSNRVGVDRYRNRWLKESLQGHLASGYHSERSGGDGA